MWGRYARESEEQRSLKEREKVGSNHKTELSHLIVQPILAMVNSWTKSEMSPTPFYYNMVIFFVPLYQLFCVTLQMFICGWVFDMVILMRLYQNVKLPICQQISFMVILSLTLTFSLTSNLSLVLTLYLNLIPFLILSGTRHVDQGSYVKSAYRLLGKFKRLIFIYIFIRLFQNNPGSKTACVPQLLANN